LVGDFIIIQSKITNANIVSENNLLVKNVAVKTIEMGYLVYQLKLALFILTKTGMLI
jgi:hypothetical protein